MKRYGIGERVIILIHECKFIQKQTLKFSQSYDVEMFDGDEAADGDYDSQEVCYCVTYIFILPSENVSEKFRLKNFV